MAHLLIRVIHVRTLDEEPLVFVTAQPLCVCQEKPAGSIVWADVPAVS
jgi:hypothetical protein